MLRSSGQEEDRPRSSGWLDLSLQVSLTLAISVTLLGWLGHWLDGLLGTEPWLLLLGVLWGAVGGTWSMVIRVKRFGEEREREEAARKDADGPGSGNGIER